MNKILKKIAVLALAGTMTLGMSVNALAAGTTSNLNTNRDSISDTSTINLIKDYVVGSQNQVAVGGSIAAGKIPTESPAETFTFTITRYGLWNVGENGYGQPQYTNKNMPTFLNGSDTTATDDTDSSKYSAIYSITASAGEAESDNKSYVHLTIPTYGAVGDYWYQVVETDNNVAGVIYGTNDSKTEDITKANGNHNAIYYIHVQVTNATTKGVFIRTVTLHKTAPNLENVTTNAYYESWYAQNNENNEGQNNKKVDNVQNKYYAGQLNITKVVKGNAGDKNELFQVTVKFTKPSEATMKSNITYKNFYNELGTQQTSATSINWPNAEANDTMTVDFYVKDGTTVTFDNIPYGVSYEITETQPRDDKYTHSFTHTSPDDAGTFNGKNTGADTVTVEGTGGEGTTSWDSAKATGSISDDSDTVTITNNKESTIDIGVITSNAPYVTILIFAAAVLILFVHRRKNNLEEY